MIVKTVSSSALGYAITFLLMVGLVCTGLLFIASVNKRIEVNYSMQEHMIFDNLFSLTFGAQMKENKTLTLPHINGDTSQLTIKNWGAFRIVVSKTFHNKKSISKSAIIGNRSLYTYSTIYLPNQKQTLKVCGETRIHGNISMSEQGLERGYIAGKNYTGDKLIYGELKTSEKYLPELASDFKNLGLQNFISSTEKIDFSTQDSTFSFANPTTLISEIGAISISSQLEGNIIIHSFESITVNREAKIDHVILIAPKITFKEGFKGSVQAIAHENVWLEKNVQLDYPSTITLNEQTKNEQKVPRGVFMEEKSRIIGGVLLTSQEPDFRNPLILSMKNSTIGGLIYNVGETEVSGKIHGYVYTNSFTLSAGGGVYKNYLLDAEIKSDALPKELILPQWIKHGEEVKGELITLF